MLAWETSVSPVTVSVDDDDFAGPDFEEDSELEGDDEDPGEGALDGDLDEDDEDDEEEYEEYEEFDDQSARRHSHPRREDWNG